MTTHPNRLLTSAFVEGSIAESKSDNLTWQVLGTVDD